MTAMSIYRRYLYWFNVAAVAGAALFLAVSAGNLFGSQGEPALAGDAEARAAIRAIEPVKKRVGPAEDLKIDPALNPFTQDRKDWVVAQQVQEQPGAPQKAPDLNLELRGIVAVKERVKAVIKDLDEPGKSVFFLTAGDFFKGYTVAYVSDQHILFTGNDKNIRFAVKTADGKFYSGRGEIFVAPDMDLYIEKLVAEESGEVAPETETDEAAASAEGAVGVTSAASAAGSGGSGGSAASAGGGGSSGGTATSISDTAADSDGTHQPTREEEMAFIREVMKIFQTEDN